MFCTMDKEGKVFCSHMNLTTSFMLPGKYKFVSMIDDIICGINFNDNVACYRIIYDLDTLKLGGIIIIEKSVKYVNTDVYDIDSNTNSVCML